MLHTFAKEYTFEDKTYTEIDIPLDNLKGVDIDRIQKRWRAAGNMALLPVLDASFCVHCAADAAVEQVCDQIEEELQGKFLWLNLSGEAVAEAVSYYHIPPGNLIVLCDDVQFPVGKMRIRRKGTHGGHNGLRNIIERLGTDEFPRIRIGVGKKPHPEYDLADWVLGHFSPLDRKTLQTLFPDVCAAVALMLDGKTEQAMALYSH